MYKRGEPPKFLNDSVHAVIVLAEKMRDGSDSLHEAISYMEEFGGNEHLFFLPEGYPYTVSDAREVYKRLQEIRHELYDVRERIEYILYGLPDEE